MIDSQVIIMAGGKGTRMQSDLPKALHKIGNRTMLDMILSNALDVTDDIILVHSESLTPHISHCAAKKILQENPKGTGHAVYCARYEINPIKNIIVLCGDNPFIDGGIISSMLSNHYVKSYDLSIMMFNRSDPKGYGRVIIDQNDMVQNIIECKDASIEEQKITTCNSGIIIFSPGVLDLLLSDLMASKNTPNAEYYLTSLIEIAYNKGLKNGYFTVASEKVIGINTKEELAIANEYYTNSKQDAL